MRATLSAVAASSLPPPPPAGGAAGESGGPVSWAPPTVPAGSAPGGGAALGSSAAPAEEPSPKRLRRKLGGRHHQVKLRLSDAELEAFQARAETANLSVQRYIVETVLAAGPEPRRPLLGRQQRALLATFMATRRTLAGAANNLNQLTRWSHAHEQAAAGINEAIAAVDGAARRLRLDVDALAESLDPEDEETATGEWEEHT